MEFNVYATPRITFGTKSHSQTQTQQKKQESQNFSELLGKTPTEKTVQRQDGFVKKSMDITSNPVQEMDSLFLQIMAVNKAVMKML